METILFSSIGKTRAAAARRYLFNRGIVSEYIPLARHFVVHVTKHGKEATLKVAETALAYEKGRHR